jgi:hypothetical protein
MAQPIGTSDFLFLNTVIGNLLGVKLCGKVKDKKLWYEKNAKSPLPNVLYPNKLLWVRVILYVL